MSRKIDYSDLSTRDLIYLGQRPWLVKEAVMQGFPDVPRRVDVAMGHAPKGRRPVTVQKPTGAPLMVEDVEDSPIIAEGDESDDDTAQDVQEEVDYEEWTTSELREECSARNMSKTGARDVLIKRLREHDEKSSVITE